MSRHDQLVPAGEDRNLQAPVDDKLRHTDRGGQSQVLRREAGTGGNHLRAGGDVLPRTADIGSGPDALRDSISRHNCYLHLLESIGELRRLKHPPLSGTAFHKILVASAVAPKDMLLDTLREFRNQLRQGEGIRDYRARLMVLGSHLDDPEYLRVIESLGGLVVADRFCFGSIPGIAPLPEDGDPLSTLAGHYLRKISCPRMMSEFENRVQAAVNTAVEYRVDGVVIEAMKFCDTWGVDSALMTTALNEAKIPTLRLEREYALTGEGQLRTRIQAFMESLGK